MKRDWKPWERDKTPPTKSAGELERVPRTAGTSTATQQIHLRVSMERQAAENLRQVWERDHKRVVEQESRTALMITLCVDVSTLDLQNYTGTIRVCSCDAFDQD